MTTTTHTQAEKLIAGLTALGYVEAPYRGIKYRRFETRDGETAYLVGKAGALRYEFCDGDGHRTTAAADEHVRQLVLRRGEKALLTDSTTRPPV